MRRTMLIPAVFLALVALPAVANASTVKVGAGGKYELVPSA